MTLKEELFQFCKSFVEQRLSRIQNHIQDIKVSLNSETKSSAGDKHETGRAMLQLEREKLGVQLSEAEKMNQVLAKVPLKTSTTYIALGSLVKTSKSNYFIAISSGEFTSKNESVFCISSQTPIGKLLLGKQKNDVITFNGQDIIITEIS